MVMTPEQRKQLQAMAEGYFITSRWEELIRAALAEIDRLAVELAKYKHLYESQHHPKHEGFKPTEAP